MGEAVVVSLLYIVSPLYMKLSILSRVIFLTNTWIQSDTKQDYPPFRPKGSSPLRSMRRAQLARDFRVSAIYMLLMDGRFPPLPWLKNAFSEWRTWCHHLSDCVGITLKCFRYS